MRKISSLLLFSAAVALFGLGCEETKPIVQTPAPIVVPPAATTTAPVADVVPTTTWKTYTDANVGFEVQYPATDSAISWSLAKDKLDLSAFPAHEGQDRWFQLITRRVSGPPAGCVNYTSDSGYTVASGTLTEIGPIGFCLYQYSDAGMGHVGDSYDYVTRKDDTEIILSFTDYHVLDTRIYEGCEDGTSKDPKCIPFNESVDTKIFRDIVETFAFTP